MDVWPMALGEGGPQSAGFMTKLLFSANTTHYPPTKSALCSKSALCTNSAFDIKVHFALKVKFMVKVHFTIRVLCNQLKGPAAETNWTDGLYGSARQTN